MSEMEADRLRMGATKELERARRLPKDSPMRAAYEKMAASLEAAADLAAAGQAVEDEIARDQGQPTRAEARGEVEQVHKRREPGQLSYGDTRPELRETYIGKDADGNQSVMSRETILEDDEKVPEGFEAAEDVDDEYQADLAVAAERRDGRRREREAREKMTSPGGMDYTDVRPELFIDRRAGRETEAERLDRRAKQAEFDRLVEVSAGLKRQGIPIPQSHERRLAAVSSWLEEHPAPVEAASADG